MAEDSLEPLVTQCPTCRTRFRVTEVQLGVAGGRVRCGACLSVFTGIDNLVAGAGPRLRPGESADSALDALLDELRKETPAAARTAVRADKTPATPAVIAPKSPKVPTAKADDGPEALPEPEVESEAAPGDIVGDDDSDIIDDAIDTAEIDARDEDIDLADEEIDLADVEVDEEIDSDAADVAAEEIELIPPVAPPPTATPSTPQPQVAAISPTPPEAAQQPKPAIARGGITSRPIKARAPTPTPIVRPVRVALDLAVDPDAMSIVPPPRRRWWVTPLFALGLGGLAALALYLQFGQWSKNPQIRPVYEFLCPKLGCRLPDMRDLDKMVSKNLVVRANPEVASALLVDAIIVNEAKFPQPFPDIELRFSALDGSPVKTHVYHSADYLAGELKGVRMIAPMTPVHIALDVEDPGPQAVNYEMAFR